MTGQSRQDRLIIQGKPAGGIGGEARRSRERRIGRITVDNPILFGTLDGVGVALADKGRLLRLFGKGPQLFFREIGFLVGTERHVEAALLVVAAQSVETVTVEKQEQECPLEGGLGLIELGTQPVIGRLVVVLCHKQLARLGNETVRRQLEVVVQADQIRIDVVEHIRVVVGVEKHRPGPDEGLQQHTPGRQALGNLFNQGVFSPGPF